MKFTIIQITDQTGISTYLWKLLDAEYETVEYAKGFNTYVDAFDDFVAKHPTKHVVESAMTKKHEYTMPIVDC